MSAFNIPVIYRRLKIHSYIFPFVSLLGAMINPQWLELPISGTNFYGPKDVRAIELRLYTVPKAISRLRCLHIRQ